MSPNDHTPTETLDLRELARPLLSRWWVVLGIVIAATAFSYHREWVKPEVFSASTQVFVQTSQADVSLGGAFGDSSRNTTNQATLLRTREVAEDVAKRVGFTGDPGVLLTRLSVTPDADSDFVTITMKAPTAELAAVYANGFAQSFIALRSSAVKEKVQAARKVAEGQLEATPVNATTKTARDQLAADIERYRALEAFPTGDSRQLDEATPPGAPIAPKPSRAGGFGFAISLVLAVALVFLLERLDRKLRRIEQVERAYRQPVLAAIPVTRDVTPFAEDGVTLAPAAREAVRSLKTNLELASLDEEKKLVLVTSAAQGEGKSTLARGLALAFVESAMNVCVLECDLRRPTATALYRVPTEHGLTEVLAETSTLEQAMKAPQLSGAVTPPVGKGEHPGTLTVITSGPIPANPPAVLGSERMVTLLKTLRDRFDVVILDAPPLLAVSDTVTLAGRVDCVVLVTRLGHTPKQAAVAAVHLLDRVGDVNIVGVVANAAPTAEIAGGYGYGYG